MGSGLLVAVAWSVVVLGLGLFALPIAALLFPGRSARGGPFAVPLALAVLTLATYWLGRGSFPAAPFVVVVGMGAASLVFVRYRYVDLPLATYTESAIVFLAGFGFAVGLISLAPAITPSGETYWNFGLIQSLLRTGQLPPQDPWFAGEPVRYYYGGHLLVATIAELTATPGRYAYNLGLATVFGAMVTGAYALARGIASVHDLPRRPAGVLGAFFVGFASNLHPVLWGTLVVLPDPIARALAGIVPVDGVIDASLESSTVLDAAHFSFTNTDFPLYSVFVRGLHPHVMSPPFLLLLGGLLLAYYNTPADARARRVGLLFATTPVIGLIAFVNTWSLPTAAGLTAVVVALSPAGPRALVTPDLPSPPDPLREWVERVAGGLAAGLLVGLIATAWVLPYFLRGLAGDPGVGIVAVRSDAWFFVIGYGGFLFVFVGYFVDDLWTDGRPATVLAWPVLVGLGLVIIGLVADFPGLSIIGPVLLGGFMLHRRNRGTFATALLIAGAGLALLIELVYVAESAESGRINTVYKVYMQLWVLWGVAAGVLLTGIRWRMPDTDRIDLRRVALPTLLVLALSVYGIAGVSGNVGHAIEYRSDPSLDGFRYLGTDHPDYAAAIGWLASHDGQPVLASAPVPEGRLYRFNASPAASLTGLPTVVGWNHQVDYRGQAAYRERVTAVDTIYAGNRSTRARVLLAYNVTFIWIGEAERGRYLTIDYSREPGISTAFQRGNVTIYRVRTADLDPGR